MTVFDQRGQKVNYQYNSAGNINFESVQNRVDLVGELEKLKLEIGKAGEAEVIDADIVTDAEYQLTKAIQQSKKSEPDKSKILDHLTEANKLIEGVSSATGIVAGIMKAIEFAQQLF